MERDQNQESSFQKHQLQATNHKISSNILYIQQQKQIQQQIQNENQQLHKTKKSEYQFYKQQTPLNDGTFDMMFQQIKKSPINSGNLQKIFFALQFQAKKFCIHKFDKSSNQSQLQTVQQKQFNSKKGQIKAYWLGHASVLLSIDSDTRIIIDPMFQKRLVPSVGQKRFLQPPCTLENLPPIDCILISHDHYDHCNQQSIKRIYQKSKFKQNFVILIGKNSKDLLPKQCLQKGKYKQLSWTHKYQLKTNNKIIQITFVPACHWSRRSLHDQNQRLWGGFVIKALGKKIYFAGDTGYCGLFKELYQQFGGFDLSLLPIGAYEPNEKLKAQHVNPKEAVMIHNDVKSQLSVGIHWGTFPMSHQTTKDVIRDFNKAIKDLKQGKFKLINIGQSVSLEASHKQKYSNIQLDTSQKNIQNKKSLNVDSLDYQ